MLLKSNLITYEEALRQATNPDDFALRVSGIAGTSDSSWDNFEQGRAALPAAAAPRAPSRRASHPGTAGRAGHRAGSGPTSPRRPAPEPTAGGAPGGDDDFQKSSSCHRGSMKPEASPLQRCPFRGVAVAPTSPPAARTERQVRARLEKAGLAGQADAVVAWLRELRYLDDAAYARGQGPDRWSGLGARRPAHRRAAAALQAGIPAAAARAAVARALGRGDQEVPAARRAARRRGGGARRGAGRIGEREKARLSRFLLARGFSGRAVSSALGVYVDEGEDR